MPLSKEKQAKWMREYRANKRVLGITARGFANSVIPKSPDIEDTNSTDIEYIDADGNPVYA